jgi:hypothetical protein
MQDLPAARIRVSARDLARGFHGFRIRYEYGRHHVSFRQRQHPGGNRIVVSVHGQDREPEARGVPDVRQGNVEVRDVSRRPRYRGFRPGLVPELYTVEYGYRRDARHGPLSLFPVPLLVLASQIQIRWKMAEPQRRVTRNHALFRYPAPSGNSSGLRFAFWPRAPIVPEPRKMPEPKPHPSPPLDLHFLDTDSNDEYGIESMHLPPELWLKVAWYILIRPDMEQEWIRYNECVYKDATRHPRFPIFGLRYCNMSASALLQIPFLGPILRHYLYSARGLTYKEIHCMRIRIRETRRLHVLDSISCHNPSGIFDQNVVSARIARGNLQGFRAKYAEHDDRLLLRIYVEWRPSGTIGITIEWRDGNPDWSAARKFVNEILPYGLKIRDMTQFMEELIVYVPSVRDIVSGDIETHPVPCILENRGPCYSEYRIEPESIVSRDILRFRPNR